MADDDYEFVSSPDGGAFMVEDKVAARTYAYISLLIETNNLKDEAIIGEAMEMLKRIRLSITAASEATLTAVRGGKGN